MLFFSLLCIMVAPVLIKVRNLQIAVFTKTLRQILIRSNEVKKKKKICRLLSGQCLKVLKLSIYYK